MFSFKSNLTSQQKNRRLVLYALTAALLMTAFTAGFITVYVNTYNIIHSEPMTVFSFCRTTDGIGVIFFNHFFELFTT